MAKLPNWVTRRKDGVMVVDPDLAYPAIAKALGVKDLDQYWVEVCFQCAKLAVQDLADQPPDKTLIIHILSDGDRKGKWTLSAFPKGRGAEAATRDREARVHYQRIKNAIVE
jgi:hypothetical protein